MDSRFQIPWFRIRKLIFLRILNFTGKNLPHSGIRIPFHGASIKFGVSAGPKSFENKKLDKSKTTIPFFRGWSRCPCPRRLKETSRRHSVKINYFKIKLLLILSFSGLLNNFSRRVRYFVPCIPEKKKPFNSWTEKCVRRCSFDHVRVK